MVTYVFPKTENCLANVISHIDAFGIEVFSVSNDGVKYTITTAEGFPDEQLEHLEMVKV